MTAKFAAAVLFVIIGTSVCTNVVEFVEFFNNLPGTSVRMSVEFDEFFNKLIKFLRYELSSNLLNSLIIYFCTNVVEFDEFFNNLLMYECRRI